VSKGVLFVTVFQGLHKSAKCWVNYPADIWILSWPYFTPHTSLNSQLFTPLGFRRNTPSIAFLPKEFRDFWLPVPGSPTSPSKTAAFKAWGRSPGLWFCLGEAASRCKTSYPQSWSRRLEKADSWGLIPPPSHHQTKHPFIISFSRLNKFLTSQERKWVSPGWEYLSPYSWPHS
jgi:hypothetical protein